MYFDYNWNAEVMAKKWLKSYKVLDLNYILIKLLKINVNVFVHNSKKTIYNYYIIYI